MTEQFKEMLLLGFKGAVRFKSKEYVMKALYNKAKRSPFIQNMKYDEYL